METLDRHTLTQATMQRQLLLERPAWSGYAAIEHLVGLQAQEPHEPYVGLWSRLRDFRPAELVDLLEQRRAVRTLLMRRTLHLVTSEDCLALRPLHDAMLVTRMRGTLGRVLASTSTSSPRPGEPLFAASPRTLTEVARAIGARWPQAAPRDLGDALSTVVRLVQTPPRGIWGQQAPARNTTIRSWLGTDPGGSGGIPPGLDRAPAADPDGLDDLVLRYLRVHGPATSSDVRAWSGLSGLPAVIKRLRPRLRFFRDERGRELLDVPDGWLPDDEVPLPCRYLPAFDNAVLGYDDRTRIIDDGHRGLSVAGARFVLVDGRVAGTWTSTGDHEAGVTVCVTPLRALTPDVRDDVVAEGQRLAVFLADKRPGGLGGCPPGSGHRLGRVGLS